VSDNQPITPLCPNPRCDDESGMDCVDNNGKVFHICSSCGMVVPKDIAYRVPGGKMTFEQYNKLHSFNRYPVRRKK
jgi:hypothetical protein